MAARDPLWPCCPNPCHGATPVPLVWVEIEARLKTDKDAEQHGEFICGPQVRYVCKRCGYVEVLERDHKEYREAAEADRCGELTLKWPPEPRP